MSSASINVQFYPFGFLSSLSFLLTQVYFGIYWQLSMLHCLMYHEKQEFSSCRLYMLLYMCSEMYTRNYLMNAFKKNLVIYRPWWTETWISLDINLLSFPPVFIKLICGQTGDLMTYCTMFMSRVGNYFAFQNVSFNSFLWSSRPALHVLAMLTFIF